MRLLRFPYSPYAAKVRALFDLAGVPVAITDVPYADRSELLALTGGYAHVPVLVHDDGRVICDSRRIAAVLIDEDARFSPLVPPELCAAAWAYADWVENQLEDELFRIASPGIRDRFATFNEQALFVLVKERKYGAGCVDRWAAERDARLARARELLAPTVHTFARRPFVLGDGPTLADAALYGQLAMLDYADPKLHGALGPALAGFRRRMRDAGCA